MKMIVVKGLVVVAVGLFAGNSHATKPGADVNPNGYPSGTHFNLNIKTHDRASFSCPEPQYDELTGEQTYGNVIHIPSDGNGIRILMESGKKGPRNAPETTVLEVTDWCTGFENDDPAVLRLPKNDQGYAVYARVLGKPSEEEVVTIYDPGLEYVIDETNNDLMELGFVTDGAFANYTDVTFKRPKGKVTAIPITNLFMWSGTVCSFTESDYMLDAEADFLKSVCCLETYPGSGEYSECVDPVLLGDGLTLGCSAGYVEEVVSCEVFDEPEWVFNIEDYVGYLWNMDTNGNNLLKVRFYPMQNVSL